MMVASRSAAHGARCGARGRTPSCRGRSSRGCSRSRAARPRSSRSTRSRRGATGAGGRPWFPSCCSSSWWRARSATATASPSRWPRASGDHRPAVGRSGTPPAPVGTTSSRSSDGSPTPNGERDTRAREAVLAERAHIARELHDVVAHHVSLIGVQAGAARTALDHSPAVTRTALEAIEAASRDARRRDAPAARRAPGRRRRRARSRRSPASPTSTGSSPRSAEAGIDALLRRHADRHRPPAAARAVLLPHRRGGADERDPPLGARRR